MILVTGAGGFIGRRLISNLSALGLDVVSLFRSERPRLGTTSWEADLSRKDHIIELKKTTRRPRTVVHLAGYIQIVLEADSTNPSGSPKIGSEDIARIYLENVAVTANLIDFCLETGVEHLIFASSQAVYGITTGDVITEESPCQPLEHYANSKLCCEKILELSTRQGINVTSLRFPGVYSEERKSGTVYEFCRRAVQDKMISVKTTMPIPFDIIYIDDLLHCIEKAIDHGGKEWLCLNVSTGEPCSLDLLADDVAELVPGCSVSHGIIAQPVVRLDPTRANTLIGWKAHPRKERLQKIVDHARMCL